MGGGGSSHSLFDIFESFFGGVFDGKTWILICIRDDIV